ncbi:aspartate aminotransferase family protein [Nocardia pseudovaccinii]|uniref:aspartate aminotransferase family protein n=1 Tax=Nocardia pseudovaccinii TaxID=189540 RepID=UPI003D908ED1
MRGPMSEHRSTAQLEQLASAHLWMNMTRQGTGGKNKFMIVERGEGCHVWTTDGRRMLDGLSSLFCVNIGHGRTDLVEEGLAHVRQLGYFPNWSAAHPNAIELAARIASLAPPNMNRTFFTSGGSESVDSAIKLARQYHKLTGNPGKYKIIARHNAYHGTTLGALAATGISQFKEPFEPVMPGGCHVPNVRQLEATGRAPATFADVFAERIEAEGPDSVAAVILEPVQSAGGGLTPPDGYYSRLREICDRYSVLLISDETVCAWGRLGTWLGAQAYDFQPDIITTAKGLTSGYAPMGAVIAADHIADPFMREANIFTHGFTFGGHPLSCAVAMANLNALENERVIEHVQQTAPSFRAALEGLRDLPTVVAIRGEGYFYSIELGHPARRSLSLAEATSVVATLGPAIAGRGLFCRVDNRAGYPCIVLAPPLIAGPEEISTIAVILRDALEELEFPM